MTDDPGWFRTAVFYEVLVRAFADSTGSGAGDFVGLTGKLDYLQWLGVDCLWIPPFYASPLRDGGYDVADYRAVLPEFGTVDDFHALLAAAHARGIRVITDIVMNHTSDAHPWFQASRTDPHGPYGDYYVWSDTDTRYAGTRIIFVDTETSNWTFDPVRGQFFWHRFFSHQPDLNIENPRVREEIFDIVRFWMGMGIDGVRLDAVPYLIEEEGHSGENHPRTHEFLAQLRAMVDREFPGRILLAEANQPPAEVVDYFGTPQAPECQMCFHFPVMPRLFYALRSQTAAPIVDVLAATPAIPPGTQWGTFLRNHDELTLEMVSEQERAEMYRWYAPDLRMRANVGIRRRLAPLLDGDRAQLELIHALVLSLPGSPCLYYGDEIGMGDDIRLPDRDASRTPMQWTPGANAGFSTAEAGQLYLPLVTSPGFTHDTVNVETMQADRGSLLHWVRHALAVRKAHPVFGVGDFTVAAADHPAVLAYLRSVPTAPAVPTAPTAPRVPAGARSVLCVANLGEDTVTVTAELGAALAGAALTGLLGDPASAMLGDPAVDASGRVRLRLRPRGYLWLHVEPTHG